MLLRHPRIRRCLLGTSLLHRATLRCNVAWYEKGRGRYNIANQSSKPSYAEWKKQRSKEHLDTLTSMKNLASVLSSQGKHEDAEQLFRQTLEANQEMLGKEHQNTGEHAQSGAGTEQSRQIRRC